MKNSSTIVSAAAVIAVFILAGIGCKPAANSNASNANVNSNTVTNANVATAANVNAAPVAEANAAPETVVGSLATPSDAYRTAYDLRKRKDVQGLKKMMAPNILEFFSMVAEEEKKSLDDVIKEMFDKPQADKAVARNEMIKGNRATVEYLTETGEWSTMDFEKIGSDWKLTFPKADPADPAAKKPK